jgi:hypothetical protein
MLCTSVRGSSSCGDRSARRSTLPRPQPLDVATYRAKHLIITQTLPLEVAAHIWDVYLYEGEMYLMCVALGILKLYAPK